jgi:minor structural protein GP20
VIAPRGKGCDTVELLNTPGAMLGYFRGRPFYLLAGGADDANDDADNGSEGDGGAGAGDQSGSGDQGAAGNAGDAGNAGQSGSTDNTGQPKPAGQSDSGASDDVPDVSGLKRALDSERALRKAKEKELRELQKKHASAEELALLQAKEAAVTETEARLRPALLKKVASAELRAAGASGNTSRLVGLLDLDQVQLDDSGDLVGMNEQIEALREEFPNLFQVAGNGKSPVPKANAGAGGNQGRKQDNSGGGPRGRNGQAPNFADKLAAQVLGH